MAEVFGAVASGAGLFSLAIQLGESAFKLKKFYDEVERAPRRLQSLARELDLFSNILRNLDNARLQHGVSDTDVLTQCIEMCEDSTREIAAATTKIETMRQRSQLRGRIYAAVKMPEVIGLCDDMERSKSSLAVAFQSFQNGLLETLLAMNQTMPTQVATLVATLLTAPPPPTASTAMIISSDQQPLGQSSPMQRTTQVIAGVHQEHESHPAQQRRPYKRLFRFRIQPPSWFKQVAWDISVLHSQGCWNIYLQTDRLVPRWAPVFFHAEEGDVSAVRQLFDDGKASPYDFYLDGDGDSQSLLEAAAGSCSIDMLNLLLNRTHQDARGTIAKLGFVEASWHGTSIQQRRKSEAMAWYLLRTEPDDIVELLVDDISTGSGRMFELPVGWDDLNTSLQVYRSMSRPQDWLNLLYMTRGLTARRIYQYCLNGSDFNALSKLREPVNKSQTIIHFVAERVGRMVVHSDWKERDGWAQLLITLFRAVVNTASLHSADDRGRTPFACFVSSIDHHAGPSKISSVISIWSQILQDAGLDHDTFFRREADHWSSGEQLFTYTSGRSLGFTRLYIRVTALSKDRSTSEWKLHPEYYEEIAIWKLHTIPGSWPTLPFLPQTICWVPSPWTIDDAKGRWRFAGHHQVILTGGSWLQEILSQHDDKRRLDTANVAYNTQFHDDEAAVRIMNTRKFSRRRTVSEPPSLPQAYLLRQRSTAGPVKYCWLHSHWCRPDLAQVVGWYRQKRGLAPRTAAFGQDFCNNRRCCTSDLLNTPYRKYEEFSNLAQQRQDFVNLHGARPAICSMVVGPSPKGAYRRPQNLIDNELLYEFVVHKHSTLSRDLCPAFPDCVHQEVHIERLRQEREYQETE